jgi:DNA-binding response OmpR family regulator
MNTAVKNRFNFKILIVEDEPDNNEFLAELLSLSGYEVDQAFDGEQGLAKVRTGFGFT